MKYFSKKMIEAGSDSPGKKFSDTLAIHFNETLNVEWHPVVEGYEAIFYCDGTEYIACFDGDANLVNYRFSLSDGFLPEIIKLETERSGEIMNAVLINHGNAIHYEIIIRDDNNRRFMLLISERGKTLEQRQL